MNKNEVFKSIFPSRTVSWEGCILTMTKKLILVAAPPACGKTYVAELISRSVGQVVYLDKDDLAELLRCSFKVSGHPMDMDGDFYRENLHDAEYGTLMRLAFSALRFSDFVIVNAPFGREVRDAAYMRALKARTAEAGAELVLIWVTASPEVCHARMIRRNSDRDTLKLKNWDAYIKTIDFSAPTALADEGAVDRLIVFNGENEETTAASLNETLAILNR